MKKLRVCIFGAGEIGAALALTMAADAAFSVQVVDPSEDAINRLRAMNVPAELRVRDHGDALQDFLAGADVAVAAVPEPEVEKIARAAAGATVHYLDFSGLNAGTRAVLTPLAARRAVLNGCGVSPGMIGNVACGLLNVFSPVTDLIIRVGAIPRYPANRLGYGQIWNVDGLIDEYTRPSAAIRGGKEVMLTPLEEHGQIGIDGVTYEEFITAGGLEDLSIFAGAAPENVTFKTIRYPGHLDYMRFLLDDLGLRHRRDMLKLLLYNGLPVIEDDILLFAVTARGYRGRQPTERTLCYRFSPDRRTGPFNALTSVATGYAATLLSMLHQGDIADRGFVEHHRIATGTLLSRPFLSPLLA